MAIVDIPIVGYKRFLIQFGDDLTATDTKAAWGMVAKTNPYPLLPTPKEPYKNEWKNEDGDDEYTSQIFYQGFEMTVQFYMKAEVEAGEGRTASADLHDAAWSFFEAVRHGTFKIYDEYTALGFRKVRYAGSDYNEGDFKERDGKAWTILTVKFKVNDPVTRMVLSNGAIVEAD